MYNCICIYTHIYIYMCIYICIYIYIHNVYGLRCCKSANICFSAEFITNPGRRAYQLRHGHAWGLGWVQVSSGGVSHCPIISHSQHLC